MKLEWFEEQPNYHVAHLCFGAIGVDVHGIARVFLVTDGYAVETGIGATVQAAGGRLGFEEAKTLATGMLEHQLRALLTQIQGALGGAEVSFGEVRPDGG